MVRQLRARRCANKSAQADTGDQYQAMPPPKAKASAAPKSPRRDAGKEDDHKKDKSEHKESHGDKKDKDKKKDEKKDKSEHKDHGDKKDKDKKKEEKKH